MNHGFRLALGCAMIALATPAFAQAGRPATLQPETDDQHQYAASVIKIVELKNQGDATVKFYGTVGGDPAMNGVYTYLAVFAGVADGWRVFRVGDFIDFTLVSEAPGRAQLTVRENFMGGNGEIGTRTRRIQLNWRMGSDGAAPATVLVTPVLATPSP